MNTIRIARRRIAGAVLIVVAGLAIAPATGAAKATGPGTDTVIPKVVYPGEKPGGPFVGSFARGQTFVVTRVSASGRWAFGHGVGTKSSLHGWVRSIALKRRTGPQFTG